MFLISSPFSVLIIIVEYPSSLPTDPTDTSASSESKSLHILQPGATLISLTGRCKTSSLVSIVNLPLMTLNFLTSLISILCSSKISSMVSLSNFSVQNNPMKYSILGNFLALPSHPLSAECFAWYG